MDMTGQILHNSTYFLKKINKSYWSYLSIIIIMTLGISSASSIYSIYQNIVFKPNSKVAEGGLFIVSTHQNGARNYSGVSYQDYIDFRDDLSNDFGVAFFKPDTFLLQSQLGGKGSSVKGWIVSENYFSLLGQRPFLGRFFIDSDINDGQNVAVISEELWSRYFGRQEDAIQKTIMINGSMYQVVGVIGGGFHGLDTSIDGQVWVNLSATRRLAQNSQEEIQFVDRSVRLDGHLLAKWKGALNSDVGRRNLDSHLMRMKNSFPESTKNLDFIADSPTISRARQLNLILPKSNLLYFVVVLIIAIVCLNISNLLLASYEKRKKEFIIRAALGASGSHLIFQLLNEGIILSLLGAISAIFFSPWVAKFILTLNGNNILARKIELFPNIQLVIFCAFTASAIMIVFSIAPALFIFNTTPSGVIRDEASKPGWHYFDIRSILIIGQVAISLMLIAASSMVLRGMLHAQNMGLGFEPSGRMVVQFSPKMQKIDPETTNLALFKLEREFRDSPGYSNLTISSLVPMQGGFSTTNIRPKDSNGSPLPEFYPVQYAVGSEFVKTMGMKLIEGRDFTSIDIQTQTHNVIVNRSFWEKIWPGQNPLACSLVYSGNEYQVIGVIENSKIVSPADEYMPILFIPFTNVKNENICLIFNFGKLFKNTQTNLIRKIEYFQPVLVPLEIRPLNEYLSEALSSSHLMLVLLGMTGFVSFVLAVLGIYSLVNYSVITRRKEFAIRLAIGATSGSIIWLVEKKFLILVLIGIVLGVEVTWLFSAVLKSLLFGLDRLDILSYLVTSLVLFVAVAIAALIPTYQTAQIDLNESLRME